MHRHGGIETLQVDCVVLTAVDMPADQDRAVIVIGTAQKDAGQAASQLQVSK